MNVPARFVSLCLGAAMAAALPAPPAAAQRGAARPQVSLPGGAVRPVILRSCTSCHGIDDYAYNALDRGRWRTLIETRCISRGATIGEEDLNVLLDYLVSTFGPTSTPFPRRYIPPEITTFFSDEEALAALNGACISCHPLDRVNQAAYNEDRWRAILVDMRQRGAVLVDEDLERLVEWLGRVRGTN